MYSFNYTKEEIKKYLDILDNATNKKEESPNRKTKCWSCQRIDCFSIYMGYKICENCGGLNGHVLGYHQLKDYERLHFRKKSNYQRKYHYEKKVNEVSKRLELTEDEKQELYSKLMDIDNLTMEILNKPFCRKRMISIFFLIKNILEEMGNEKYKLVWIKTSSSTLENHEKWWQSYRSLK